RHEEFVTALLVEIDPESGRTTIFNCGHPAPLLIPAAGDAVPAFVTLKEVLVPAPPLGLLTLGDCSAAQLDFSLRPGDQLLLYTDGVTEARDASRAFYPLPERVTALSAKSTIPIQAATRALRLTTSASADGGTRQACSTSSAPICSSTSAPPWTTTRPSSSSTPPRSGRRCAPK